MNETSKPTIEHVTKLQLLGFLTSNGTATRFVAFTIHTPVEKIKVSHPFGNLFKVAKHRGYINANYVTGVRKRIAEKLGVELKDVDYTPGKSAYQHAVIGGVASPSVLVKASNPDDGVFYLQFTPDETYHPKSVYVKENGEVVPDELVKPWLYATKPRPDWKPPVFSPKLSNIVELHASGVILKAEDADEAAALLETVS